MDADIETPVVRRVVAIWTAAGAFVAGVVLTSAIAAVVAVAGDDTSSAGSSTSTLPVQLSLVQPTQTTREVPPAGGISDRVTNGGITLTVQSVTETATIERVYDGALTPRAGAKLVVVQTLVENTGTQSIEPTCGRAVSNKLWDIQKRQFDPIAELFQIPGNPDCTEKIQPGFSAQMTYVYEVPQDAVIQWFGFADSKVNYGADTSFIALR